MNENIINARLDDWHDEIDIFIRQGDDFVTDFIFTKIDKGSIIPSKLSISKEAAQLLIDDLWKAGIRPTIDYKDKEAIKLHLQDMRRLVFELLGKRIEDKK